MASKRRKLRYAVVGQGHFAQVAVLPAFATATNAELAALVSGDGDKRAELGRKYGVEKLVGYDEYPELLDAGDIDAVYIATPNTQHAEHALIAAERGVHVLVEKPMATTEEDCERMIEACRDRGVKLMVAYRLHFEPCNLSVIDMVRSGRLGDPRLYTSAFTMQVTEGNIRTRGALGGGPEWDIGVYCLNAARYVFRDEPTEVFAYGASADDPRFREVHESIAATLRFPGERLATIAIGFGAADVGWYEVLGSKGWVRVDPAFEYADELRWTALLDGRERKRRFKKRDQIAAEISAFSDCVLDGREPEPSGAEGLADVRIVRAIQRSLSTQRPVRFEDFQPVQRPAPEQEVERPAHGKPDEIDVRPPHH